MCFDVCPALYSMSQLALCQIFTAMIFLGTYSLNFNDAICQMDAVYVPNGRWVLNWRCALIFWNASKKSAPLPNIKWYFRVQMKDFHSKNGFHSEKKIFSSSDFVRLMSKCSSSVSFALGKNGNLCDGQITHIHTNNPSNINLNAVIKFGIENCTENKLYGVVFEMNFFSSFFCFFYFIPQFVWQYTFWLMAVSITWYYFLACVYAHKISIHLASGLSIQQKKTTTTTKNLHKLCGILACLCLI